MKPAIASLFALGTTFCLMGTKTRHEVPTFGTRPILNAEMSDHDALKQVILMTETGDHDALKWVILME